jgi:hypothetical protein
MGGLLRGAGAVTADPLKGLSAHGVGRGLEPEAAAVMAMRIIAACPRTE